MEGHLAGPQEAGLIIGETGVVIGDIKDISTILIDGRVVGNLVNIESITIRNTGSVHGHISCKSLECFPSAVVVGSINTKPFEPIKQKLVVIAKSTDNNNDDDDEENDAAVPQTNIREPVKPVKPPADKVKPPPRAPSPPKEKPTEVITPPMVEKKEDVVKPIKIKTTLLIIDPQIDFHKGGSCPVPGADIDSDKIAEFISHNIANIDEVYVSMDSHHRMHIAHGIFWHNELKENPRPDTVITLLDLEKGVWTPRDSILQEHCQFYLKSLELSKRLERRSLTIKSEHCLIGTRGHSIVACINEALQEWSLARMRKIGYIMKGTNCLVDTQSAILCDVEIENDPSTSADMVLLKRLFNTDKLVIAGHTSSKVLVCTVRDMLEKYAVFDALEAKEREGRHESKHHHSHHSKKLQLSEIHIINDHGTNVRGGEESSEERHLLGEFWEGLKVTGVKVSRSNEVFL